MLLFSLFNILFGTHITSSLPTPRTSVINHQCTSVSVLFLFIFADFSPPFTLKNIHVSISAEIETHGNHFFSVLKESLKWKFLFRQWLQFRGGVYHHGHPACSASGTTACQGRGVLGDPGVGASWGQSQCGAAQIHTWDPGGQQREYRPCTKTFVTFIFLYIKNRPQRL